MSPCVYSQYSVLNFCSFKDKISKLLTRFVHSLILRAIHFSTVLPNVTLACKPITDTGIGNETVLTL